MQKAALSDCQNPDSSQNPSGRSRKVSIGITVENWPKIGPELRKDDTIAVPARVRTSSHQAAEQNTRQGIVEALERNRSEIDDQKAVAWFSRRSLHIDIPAADSVKFLAKQASVIQSEDTMQRTYGTVAYGKRREKDGNVETVEEVAFASMKESKYVDNASAGEECEKVVKCSEKRLNTINYGNKRKKGLDVDRTKEVAFSMQQLVGEENGKEPEKMVKGNTQSLRMKLSAMLDTAPVQNKHTINSSEIVEHEEGINTKRSSENKKGKVTRTEMNSVGFMENKENLNVNQNKEYREAREKLKPGELEENNENLNGTKKRENQKGKAARVRQNSDTIETDSESPNQVMRRPITRSLTHKKVQPKRLPKLQHNAGHGKKPLSSSSSDFKLQLEEKNIFSFDEIEGKESSLCHTSSGHCNRSKDNTKGKLGTKVDPKTIPVHQSITGKILQNSCKEQIKLSSDKSLSRSKEKGGSSLPRQVKEKLLQTLDGTPIDRHYSQRYVQLNFGSPLPVHNRGTRESTESPLFKVRNHLKGHENNPPQPKNTFLHDNVAYGSTKRETGHLENFQSPTLAMTMSPTSPSMCDNEVLYNLVGALSGNPILKSGLKDLDNSTPRSSPPDAHTESSDDTSDTHKHGDTENPLVDLEETEKHLSISQGEDDTESDADDFKNQSHRLPSDDFGSTDKWFPSAESPEKSPFSLHHTKRVRSVSGVKMKKVNLPLPSKIGNMRTEETVGSFEDVKHNSESSLERCVAQLSLVLEGFRTKMKSQTSKRSSEILSAAKVKISQQIQDVESQIMSDVGKFNSIGKLKRKRLESRFQEQQERLKLIHDKFKEEVSKHLLDCRATLEELEACNVELKGSLDKQRASHRKLLLQVTQAMEAQINDAEASITAIDKDARKKMAGLKSALKEWMN